MKITIEILVSVNGNKIDTSDAVKNISLDDMMNNLSNDLDKSDKVFSDSKSNILQEAALKSPYNSCHETGMWISTKQHKIFHWHI